MGWNLSLVERNFLLSRRLASNSAVPQSERSALAWQSIRQFCALRRRADLRNKSPLLFESARAMQHAQRS